MANTLKNLQIDPTILPEVIRLLRKTYDGWESCANPSFQTDEVVYKRNASQKAQSLLSEAALAELLEKADYSEIIRRVREVAQATNLMHMSHPSSGDLNLINQPGLDEAAFCAEFYHLLYDGQPVAARLNQFFDFVKQQRLSPKWTFPTYFLFLRYPDNEIFIKPMMTRWFVDLMNGPKTYPSTPSGEAYEMMRDMFHQMKEALAKYDPQDMIDIHSMLWPAYRQAEKEASRTLAEPFATFFTDFEEANWAFELMHEAAISAGIVDKDDKRVAINVRSPYLRFNFGNWAFMEFKRGKVGLVFQEGKVPSTLFDYKWDKFAKSDMCLYFFNTNDLRPMHEKILTIYKQSCELVGKRFRRWKASNYRKAHQQELIEAVFDESVREKLLLEGLEYAPSDPTETTRYWRITLPEKLIVSTNSGVVEIPIWTVCRQYNIAAIDFSEDLSDPQVKKFMSIQPGDWIVAFLLDKRIGGIGEVTAAFDEQLLKGKPSDQNYWDGQFWFRLEVDWHSVEVKVDDLSTAAANKFMRKTVQELTEDEFQEVIQLAESIDRYKKNDFLAETHLESNQLENMLAMIEDKRQLIFYGPPGTGKTFVARALAKLLTGLAKPSSERVRIVQFHPAFGYEDFIEGIRPERIELENGLSSVDYPTRAGIFRSFCEQAAKDKGQKYVFIIDEINRGNIPRIFGELMLLLEYREEKVTLPYSGEEFSIPKNVYLIGTMNTADRSIALVDFALRRRFHFFQFKADPDLFARWLDRNPNEITYLKELYTELTAHAIDDPNFQIGHSYFMDAEMTKEKLARIWRYSIEPSLEEYYMGQQQKADLWRWDGERVKRIRLGNESARQS